MKGEVKTGDENAGNKMLTNGERRELAAAMSAAVKQGQAFDKGERTQAVADILLHRDKVNTKGGRKFIKLSPHTRRTLRTGKPGKDFWKSFFIEHRDAVCITKEKVTSIMRLKQCTYAVAEKHNRDLTALLILKDIYDPEEDCIFDGKEGNIIWQDEMGQFFRYMLRKGTSANVVGATGVPARAGEVENRTQFSYDGALGGDLFIYDIHLILRAEGFSADMAPPCIKRQPHYMIGITDKGCQVGATFLARQKNLVKQARARGIRGPIVFVTDGHASRFYIEFLCWLDNSANPESADCERFCGTGNDMYITPPNATETCCVLDQLFKSLHRAYGKWLCKEHRSKDGVSLPVGRYEAS